MLSRCAATAVIWPFALVMVVACGPKLAAQPAGSSPQNASAGSPPYVQTLTTTALLPTPPPDFPGQVSDLRLECLGTLDAKSGLYAISAGRPAGCVMVWSNRRSQSA